MWCHLHRRLYENAAGDQNKNMSDKEFKKIAKDSVEMSELLDKFEDEVGLPAQHAGMRGGEFD